MKVARILKDGKETFAVVNDTGMFATREDLQNQTGIRLPSALEDFVFEGHAQKLSTARLSYSHDIKQARLLPPVKRTFKIICLAFNYSDQASWVRFGKSPPKDPVIYMKPRTALAGPLDDITCPRSVTQLDYEGELAVVIGRQCSKVEEGTALDYVAGYFVINDVSARDIQFMDKQYTRAKGFDTFGPCGPWLTTKDEIADPCDLRLVTRVNGEVRQDSSTKNLVLKIDRIISSLSKAMTLEPGDIISTGTPSGTVLSLSSHVKYLQHGDVVEVEIEKLGKIRNRIAIV
ncbi:fumarylacetoacetate hydrolase family protein [Candidatus Nitrososphaera sp. FF02]|uniref:fumarylacetoacetate hydrolase family protein n=1 Tax=Candidatus Nitrososphaera sp. FF02 TaxID=3398226 RepID=UPI0039EAAE5B